MSNSFSRSQILKATGAFIAGAAATKTLQLFSDEPAQAQTQTLSRLTVSSGSGSNDFNSPQVQITQTNPNDFARLRFNAGSRPLWDIAIGGSGNLMNFFAGAINFNVMTLTSGGNVGIGTVGPAARLQVLSEGGFGLPQVQISQTNANDFARLRFNAGSRPLWDIAIGGSSNVMNFFAGATSLNVISLNSNGNVQVAGTLTQSSSRELKENIAELSSKEAFETLEGLSPIKFNYKANREKQQQIGFIAEDVPELVATSDRKALSAMDIVGVLTKVVQEQQKTILALAEKVKVLEENDAVS